MPNISDWTYELKDSDLFPVSTAEIYVEPVQPSNFSIEIEDEEIIRFDPSGDIYVHGKFVENDKQVVDAFRDIMNWEQSEIGRLTRENESLKQQLEEYIMHKKVNKQTE